MPFLDWTADKATEVGARLREQWRAIESLYSEQIHFKEHATVLDVAPGKRLSCAVSWKSAEGRRIAR